MSEEVPSPSFRYLAHVNARFLERARRTDGRCPEAVLNLWVGISLLNDLVQGPQAQLGRLLDEALLEQLRAEELRLSGNLDHLESLLKDEPDSPDLEDFSEALIKRIRKHLRRKERIVYRSLERLASISQEAMLEDSAAARGKT